jgi:hypothetical protein
MYIDELNNPNLLASEREALSRLNTPQTHESPAEINCERSAAIPESDREDLQTIEGTTSAVLRNPAINGQRPELN